MTWRLPTCFRDALLLLVLINAGFAATVSGRVELRDLRETGSRKAADFAGVVVWLEPMVATPVAAIRSVMIQKNKRFSPHVLVVPAGSAVEFPNYDPIFHNAFSNFDGQVFDVGLYPPGTSRTVRFDRPGIVRVFCNIHPAMSAVIAVVPSPYFATTSMGGSFEINGVPPGEYRLRVFHERATPSTLAALGRRLTVEEGGTIVPVIAISESGYLPLPHKNKFGKEYPPPEDNPLYPGARK